MSFICGVCRGQSIAGMPATRVVTERRVKVYAKEGGETVEGWEIVREVLAHSECASTTESAALAARERARKAAIGNVTIADLSYEQVKDLANMNSVRTDIVRADIKTRDQGVYNKTLVLQEAMPDIAAIEIPEVLNPEPVPAQKLEEVFGKPKKQKRAKKAKAGEEAN